MLLQIVRSKQPFTIALLPILAVLLWFKAFKNIDGIDNVVYTTPWALWISHLAGKGMLYLMLYLSLLTATVFYANYLNTKYIFIPERTYLPGFMLLLLISVMKVPNIPVVLAMFCILVAFDRLVATYKVEYLVYNVFDASVLVALATLFYFPSFLMLIVVWAGIITLRPSLWREWAYSILGFVTPFFFIWSYFFISGKEPMPFLNILIDNFKGNNGSLVFTKSYLIFIVISGIVMLIASQKLLSIYPTMKIIGRKTFNLLLVLFLTSFLMPIVVMLHTFDFWYLMSIPLAYLFSVFFLNTKKHWWGEVLFILFVASVLLVVYFL